MAAAIPPALLFLAFARTLIAQLRILLGRFHAEKESRDLKTESRQRYVTFLAALGHIYSFLMDQ
jgi:hypothetical protein